MEHHVESQRNPWQVDGGRRQTVHVKDGIRRRANFFVTKIRLLRPALHCGSGIRSNQMKYDFLLK